MIVIVHLSFGRYEIMSLQFVQLDSLAGIELLKKDTFIFVFQFSCGDFSKCGVQYFLPLNVFIQPC